MNGFLVFDTSVGVARFLALPEVRELCATARFLPSSSQPAVVTFRNLPDDAVELVQTLASRLGGSVRESRQYQALSR